MRIALTGNPISGKNIPFCVAGPRGLVSTGMSNELEPNTTYYLRLDCGPACDLVLKVAAPSMETAVAETADTEAGAFNPLLDKLAIEPGASQSTAIPLPLNTTVTLGAFRRFPSASTSGAVKVMS